jgi:hypothetical protein
MIKLQSTRQRRIKNSEETVAFSQEDERTQTDTRSMLVVTFYGPRHDDQLQALATWLLQAFDFPGVGNANQSYPRFHPHNETILHYFYPIAADTAVVQLILQAPGHAEQAWPLLRQKLLEAHTFDDNKHVFLSNVLKQTCEVWGYTLIYQAMLTDTPVTEQAEHPRNLLEHAWQLYDQQVWQQALGHIRVPGGRVWLVDVPSQSVDTTHAATVYMALSDDDPENTLVKKVIAGPHAELLMPDLIAHKSYYLMRDYRIPDFANRYTDRIDQLKQAAEQLIEPSDDHTEQKMDNLAKMYQPFAILLGILSERQIDFQQQLANYARWHRGTSVEALLEIHRENIVTIEQEMGLMLAKAHNAQQLVKTVLDIVQTRHAEATAKARERENMLYQYLGIMLAAISGALAVPEIISWDVSNDLLCFFLDVCNIPTEPGEAASAMRLWPFLVQVCITIVIMVFIGLIVWLWFQRRTTKNKL